MLKRQNGTINIEEHSDSAVRPFCSAGPVTIAACTRMRPKADCASLPSDRCRSVFKGGDNEKRQIAHVRALAVSRQREPGLRLVQRTAELRMELDRYWHSRA